MGGHSQVNTFPGPLWRKVSVFHVIRSTSMFIIIYYGHRWYVAEPLTCKMLGAEFKTQYGL